jgi:hypothetical protein
MVPITTCEGMTDYGTQPFAFTATAAQAANIANRAITVATKATQKFLAEILHASTIVSV